MNAKLKLYETNENIGLEYASGERKIFELIKKARMCAKQSLVAHHNKNWTEKSEHLTRSYEIIHMLKSSLQGNYDVTQSLHDVYSILLYWLTEGLKNPSDFESKIKVFDATIEPIEEAWHRLAFK